MKTQTYRYGHNEACQGAVGYCNEVTEDRRYGNRVIQLLQEAGNTCIDCTPPPMVDANEELVYGVNVENQHTSDVFLSFHINASDNQDAHGCETCVYDNTGLANGISNGILRNLSNLGFYNRGIKERPDLYEPCETHSVCIIIEPFFVTNKEDVDRYNSNFEAFCRAIANGIDNAVPLQIAPPVQAKPTFIPPNDFVFNSAWYLEQNKDVADAKVDPYQHYINNGWLEGRLPSINLPEGFLEGSYLYLNPDVDLVVTSGQCPSGKWHYKMFGYAEGRQYKVIKKSQETIDTKALEKALIEEKKKIWEQINKILK